MDLLRIWKSRLPGQRLQTLSIETVFWGCYSNRRQPIRRPLCAGGIAAKITAEVYRERMAEYVLFKGRPETNEGRLDKEIRCYDLLDALGMEYWRTDHPDAQAFTMEACREIDAVLGAVVCKNLFLTNRQHTAHYLLLMPGDKVFKTKELSSQINSARLSFGSAEEMEEMLDCTPGSSSILGLMNDRDNRVQLLVDEDVLGEEFLGCHPCINTSSLKIYTEDAFGKLMQAMHHEMKVVKLVGEQ